MFNKNILFITILIYSINLLAQAPDTLWTKIYGGISDDYGYSVKQTSDGGYIITGYTESFGNGGSDVYLIKTNISGDTSWTNSFGGSYNDYGYSVQQTSDAGFIVVGEKEVSYNGYSAAYIIKTYTNGNTDWIKTYGGTNYYNICHSVQQTFDGGYIITGVNLLIGHELFNVLLMKTNENGDTIWTKTYGGIYNNTIDYGRLVQQTSDSGYIIVGYTNSFGAGNFDVYLIKTDIYGDTMWTKTFGGVEDDRGYSVQQTSDRGYIIAGYTKSFGAGGKDVYLIKTNENGDTIWSKFYGGFYDDYGYSVQQTSDGGYIIAGQTYSFGAGSYDVYLIKTNSYGDSIWTKTFGTSGGEGGESVQQTSDFGFIIAGYKVINNDYYVYLLKTKPYVGIEENNNSQDILFFTSVYSILSNKKILINYTLQNRSNISIDIYNILGEKVKTLAKRFDNAGNYTIVWDGRNDNGLFVPCGIYFCSIETNSFSQTIKLVKMGSDP